MIEEDRGSGRRNLITRKEKGGVLRETSPLTAEIGDPGYYSVDSVYFSGFSLAFPQEGKAVKRNEHRKKGVLRETSPICHFLTLMKEHS